LAILSYVCQSKNKHHVLKRSETKVRTLHIYLNLTLFSHKFEADRKGHEFSGKRVRAISKPTAAATAAHEIELSAQATVSSTMSAADLQQIDDSRWTIGLNEVLDLIFSLLDTSLQIAAVVLAYHQNNYLNRIAPGE
jgi:hypothetical protein